MNDKQNMPLSPEDAQSLANSGYISPETLALMNPAPAAPLPSTMENQITTPPAPYEFKSNPEHDKIKQNLNSIMGVNKPVIEPAIALPESTQPEASQEIQPNFEQQAQDANDIAVATNANKEAIKSEIGKENAIQSAANQQQKELDSIQAEIDKENEAYKNMTMNDIFEDDKAPISKTQAIIAIMLGGIGQGLMGGGPNLGLEAVNKTMDDYFEKKKFTQKEKVAKKQRVFDLMKLQLDRQAMKTDDQLKLAKISQIQSEIEMNKQKLSNDQAQAAKDSLLAQRLASPEGLSREEVFALDPKMQDKAVVFSDGRARFAVNSETAKKLRNEVIPNAKSAIDGINKLKSYADKFAGGSFSLADKAEADTVAQALKGSLRLELFGPGVMTDKEQALANKIIGNPTSVLSFSNLEKRKLDTLMKKLEYSTKEKIKAAGIQLPPSKNEQKIQQVMKMNKGLSRDKAMSALIEAGKWDSEESSF